MIKSKRLSAVFLLRRHLVEDDRPCAFVVISVDSPMGVVAGRASDL